MPKVGLKKVLKTVRGKRGTTRRAYWVKSQGDTAQRVSLGQFARKHGATWVAGNLATGAAGGAGAYMAARHGRKLGGDAMLRAIGGHAVAGAGAAIAVGRSKRGRALANDYGRMGFGARFATNAVGSAAHVAGVVGGFVGTHKAHSIFGPNSTKIGIRRR